MWTIYSHNASFSAISDWEWHNIDCVVPEMVTYYYYKPVGRSLEFDDVWHTTQEATQISQVNELLLWPCVREKIHEYIIDFYNGNKLAVMCAMTIGPIWYQWICCLCQHKYLFSFRGLVVEPRLTPPRTSIWILANHLYGACVHIVVWRFVLNSELHDQYQCACILMWLTIIRCLLWLPLIAVCVARKLWNVSCYVLVVLCFCYILSYCFIYCVMPSVVTTYSAIVLCYSVEACAVLIYWHYIINIRVVRCMKLSMCVW